jgi:hypothetical protein
MPCCAYTFERGEKNSQLSFYLSVELRGATGAMGVYSFFFKVLRGNTTCMLKQIIPFSYYEPGRERENEHAAFILTVLLYTTSPRTVYNPLCSPRFSKREEKWLQTKRSRIKSRRKKNKEREIFICGLVAMHTHWR